MSPKEDLRIRRTKKMIKEAFIDLMLEKNYEQITICEIADKAMINRNTFYLHYRDKADLIEKISEGCIEELRQSVYKLRETEDVYHPMYHLETSAVFYYLEQNLRIYQALLLKGRSPYFNRLFKTFLYEAMIQEIQHQQVFDYKNLQNLKIYTEFYASGYFGVIVLWLENENIPLSDVKKTINQIINGYLQIDYT